MASAAAKVGPAAALARRRVQPLGQWRDAGHRLADRPAQHLPRQARRSADRPARSAAALSAIASLARYGRGGPCVGRPLNHSMRPLTIDMLADRHRLLETGAVGVEEGQRRSRRCRHGRRRGRERGGCRAAAAGGGRRAPRSVTIAPSGESAMPGWLRRSMTPTGRWKRRSTARGGSPLSEPVRRRRSATASFGPIPARLVTGRKRGFRISGRIGASLPPLP